MNLIVCIDDHGGMAFNHRRQSRDREQRDYLDEMLKGKSLWMTSYTAALFEPDLPRVHCFVSERPFQEASYGDYVLCEREDPGTAGMDFEEIILFHWNRSYPYDLLFPEKLLEGKKLIRTEELKGSSHDSITVEVYANE